MAKIVECVPNFSEGRDRGKLDAITRRIGEGFVDVMSQTGHGHLRSRCMSVVPKSRPTAPTSPSADLMTKSRPLRKTSRITSRKGLPSMILASTSTRPATHSHSRSSAA